MVRPRVHRTDSGRVTRNNRERHHRRPGFTGETIPPTVVDLSNAFPEGRPCMRVAEFGGEPYPDFRYCRLWIGFPHPKTGHHPNTLQYEVTWPEFVAELRKQHLRVLKDQNGVPHVRYTVEGKALARQRREGRRRMGESV